MERGRTGKEGRDSENREEWEGRKGDERLENTFDMCCMASYLL